MQVGGLLGTLAGEGVSGYSLAREVQSRDMTDAPEPTRAQRFRDVVVPAAVRAGYTGHGAKARFSRDTGMTDSTVSRLWAGSAVPDARFFSRIADVTGLNLGTLLVEGGVVSREALPSLSGTDRSRVGSEEQITPEEAADRLGIKDAVGRELFYATIERLKRLEDQDGPERGTGHGGAAAQM
jgi:transcriptional regulator with XRE-family HTH domain